MKILTCLFIGFLMLIEQTLPDSTKNELPKIIGSWSILTIDKGDGANFLAADNNELTANELLQRSIAYHDPKGVWRNGTFKITDHSKRPDGGGRHLVLFFFNAKKNFEMESTVNNHKIKIVVENNIGKASVDGRTDISLDELKQYRLTEKGILEQRNFWFYLYGIPMKLTDSGTNLDSKIKETIFEGRAVYELRVTYDEKVGRDIWYFYLDRNTYALVGHRFHHNGDTRTGEYTVFRDEISGQGLRLPRIKEWHTNEDGKLFVTHTTLSIDAP